MGYTLKAAFEDLHRAGLLGVSHVHQDGRWRRAAGDEPVLAELFFRCATLDSRAVGANVLFVALQGLRQDGRDFIGDALRRGAAAALTRSWDGGADPVLSADPRHDACILTSPNPELALTALAAAHRERSPARMLGVTGSNGKTTTKDLLATILSSVGRTLATSGNLNNDLGVPLTLLGLGDDDRFAVIEMGASGPGDIARLAGLVKPSVGVITNAGNAHLEGLGDLDGVIGTKGELLASLPGDGRAVLNADSPGFDRWCASSPCPVVSWGEQTGDHRWSWAPAAVGGGILTIDDRHIETPLLGRHNAANLTAAVLAAEAACGCRLDISRAMNQFVASPHRGQMLEIAGVQFIDDSYNANPASLLASAETLAQSPVPGRRIAVIGAMAELGAGSAALHRETGLAMSRLGLDLVLGVGEGTVALVEGCLEGGARAEACTDHAAAVERLLDYCRSGDRVLVKGSRSAGMEIVPKLFESRRNPDLGRL